VNFLEQLVAEWYAYRGFFVRTNIKFGKRGKGGYKGEMDVVAFHPQGRTLVHIEASSDAYSWPKRKEMFRKKFQIEEQLYASLRSTHPMKAAVPEVYPLLRAIQFAVWSDKDDG
jgi:hypothetical protein